MSKELPKLHNLLKKTNKERSVLMDRITELERKEKLPDLKKKYEGSYFRFKNSYSCPESDKDRWWLYFYIYEVVDGKTFKGFSFQTDKYGEITIHSGEINVTTSSIETTKDEFYKAYHKMLETATKMQNG